jgi:septal ring factor EnvC (AmiA/AmiB activator)
LCITASSWETRQLKAELADSKTENAKLEKQIKNLHHLRNELHIIHEDEKTRLLKQWEQYRKTVRLLKENVCSSQTHPD